MPRRQSHVAGARLAGLAEREGEHAGAKGRPKELYPVGRKAGGAVEAAMHNPGIPAALRRFWRFMTTGP